MPSKRSIKAGIRPIRVGPKSVLAGSSLRKYIAAGEIALTVPIAKAQNHILPDFKL